MRTTAIIGQRIRLAALAAFLSAQANAQFTYTGFTFEWDRTRFYGSGNDKTVQNQFAVLVGGLHRPIRNLGIGAYLVAPFGQSTKGGPKSTTTDGSTFDDFDTWIGSEGRYKPITYAYDLEQKMSYRLLARLFVDGSANLYFEGSASFIKLTETVNIFRLPLPAEYYEYSNDLKYGAVEGVFEYESFSYSTVASGIRLGVSPHLSKGVYLDMNLGWQFMSFSGTGFSYTLSHDWGITSEQHEYVTLQSVVPGSHTTFSAGFGIGAYF